MLTVNLFDDNIPTSETLLQGKVKEIRAEIFRLARQSLDLETMHWYMWLDSCFENDEFTREEFGNIQWRCFVLQGKGEPVYHLLNLISYVLRVTGCIDAYGKSI